MTGTAANTNLFTDLIEHDRELIQDPGAERWLMFRNDWLPRYVSAAEYEQVKDLNLDLLLSLYPKVYVYGPRAAEVEAVVAKVIVKYVEGGDTKTRNAFYKAMINLYAYAWEEVEEAHEHTALQEAAAAIGMWWALYPKSENTNVDAQSFSVGAMRYAGNGFLGGYPADIFLQVTALDGLLDLKHLGKLPGEEQKDDWGEWVWVGPEGGEPLKVTQKLFKDHHDFLRKWGLA